MEQKMSSDGFKMDIINLISQNFGGSAAVTFRDFYYDEDRQSFVDIAVSMLSDLIGLSKTKELIRFISKKHHVEVSV